jgi:hypothetical protein
MQLLLDLMVHDNSTLLHEVSPPSISAALLRDLPEVKLHAPSSGSDGYRSMRSDLMAQISFSLVHFSWVSRRGVNGPDLFPSA